jgi:hypothetical protein
MTLDEYAKHMAKMYPVVWIDGVPWRATRRMLEPLAAPHTMKPVDRAKVRQAMRETRAVLARWNDAWDTAPGEWWWICCDDRQYDVERLSRNRRKTVRKGCRLNEVRLLDNLWFAENAFEVYAASYKRYDLGIDRVDREGFVKGALQAAECKGRETWGAFVDGKMIAYMSCLVVDDVVHVSSNKWDPDYGRVMPNDALEYTLTRHYLAERGVAYVTSGVRVLHHDTHTQDFDESMGYRRVYCPLRVELSPLAALAVGSGLGRWGPYAGLAKVMPSLFLRLRAASRLAAIARSRSSGAAPVKVSAAGETPGEADADDGPDDGAGS